MLILAYQVGNGSLIPLEMCTVPPGQIMRKQVPPDKTKEVLDFATKRPEDRLASIRNGLMVGRNINIHIFRPVLNLIIFRFLPMDNLNMCGSSVCTSMRLLAP